MNRTLLFPGFLMFVLLFGSATLLSCSKGSDSLEFSTRTVDGSPFSTSDLNGQVVLINYWGTWCPPCVREIPHFQETYEQFKDDGFVILGIALPQGGQGGLEDVRSFMDENEMSYPVVMEEQVPIEKLQERYGTIKNVPTSILLDRNGNHVETFVGYTQKEELMDKLDPLLNK